jgi:hypothetical protein
MLIDTDTGCDSCRDAAAARLFASSGADHDAFVWDPFVEKLMITLKVCTEGLVALICIAFWIQLCVPCALRCLR